MKGSTLAIFVSLIGLLVYFVARVALYISNYSYFSSIPNFEVIKLVIFGIRFDSSVYFITGLLAVMLIIPLKNQLWRKIWMWVIFLTFIPTALFLASDIIYFSHVSQHISSEVYHLGNEKGFIIKTMFEYKYLLAVLLTFFIVLGFFYKKLAAKPIIPERYTPLKIILFLLICFIGIRGSFTIKPISTVDAFKYGSREGNLVLNGVMSAYRYNGGKNIVNHTYYTDEEAFKNLDLDINSKYPLMRCFDGGNKRNIVVLIMESWSAYYMGAYGSNYNVTPNFDLLSSKGILFYRHYAPEKRSIDGIQAILTGVPRINGMPSLGFGLEVHLNDHMAGTAVKNGFNTIFMQTSKRRSYYMDSIASAIGFKEYYGMEDIPLTIDYPDQDGSVFGWDYEGLQTFANILNKSKKPFIAAFFSGTTHTPFAKMPKGYNIYDNATKSNEAGFLNTLYYADSAVGNFFQEVSKMDWFDNTVFIITADHTLGKFEKVVFPNDYHIPLLIYDPKGEITVANKNQVTSHIDIMPTILEISGIQGCLPVAGRSLISEDGKEKAFIYMGDRAALIGDDGWVIVLGGETLEVSGDSDSLKSILLSYQQVVSKLLKENRWFK